MSDPHALTWCSNGYCRALLAATLLHICVTVFVITLAQYPIQSIPRVDNVVRTRLVEPENVPAKDMTGAAKKTKEQKKPDVPLREKLEAASRQQILQHWNGRQLGITKGLSCLLQIRVTGDGAVKEVRILRSSGSQTFDDSVIDAIRKASPLPVPPQAEAHDGLYQFEFLFDPS